MLSQEGTTQVIHLQWPCMPLWLPHWSDNWKMRQSSKYAMLMMPQLEEKLLDYLIMAIIPMPQRPGLLQKRAYLRRVQWPWRIYWCSHHIEIKGEHIWEQQLASPHLLKNTFSIKSLDDFMNWSVCHPLQLPSPTLLMQPSAMALLADENIFIGSFQVLEMIVETIENHHPTEALSLYHWSRSL